jgi:hypothetical protein
MLDSICWNSVILSLFLVAKKIFIKHRMNIFDILL